MKSLTLIPGQLSLSQLRDVYSHPVNITLDSGAFAAIDESVACVNAILAEGRTAYGINTGFGLLAQAVSRRKIWRTCSVRWCYPTRRALASRWTMIWRG